MPSVFSAIWLLAGIRLAALFVVSPFFGNRLVPRVALLPVAGVMGLFGALQAPTGVVVGELTWSSGSGAILFEIFVGLILGLTSRLLFSVFEVVGELASRIIMPATGNVSVALPVRQSTPAIFVTVLGTCLFFLVGGHHALIGAFFSTLRCIPLGGLGALPGSVLGFAEQFTLVFGMVLTWSVLLALPLLFVAVAVELIGGIVVSFGQMALGPVIPVVRTLATQAVLVALWYTIVRVAISYLLVFVEEHPLCGMLASK